MMDGDKTLQLLLIASLKGTLVLIIAWMGMIIFKRSSASIRHWICSLALVSTIAIPVLSLAAPVWSVPILPDSSSSADSIKSGFDITELLFGAETRRPVPVQNNEVNAPQVDNNAGRQITSHPNATVEPITQSSLPLAKPVTPAISWTAIVLLMWVLGSVIALIRWLAQARHVWSITRRGAICDDPIWTAAHEQLSHRLKIRRAVRLVVSNEVTVPLTWGLWRPTIVLPAAALDWSAERSEIVLLHELAHIVRWDYLTQWVALLSCAINWFNPFVWKLARVLSDEREQACDDKVLEMGTRSSDYANNLLEISQALRPTWSAQLGVLAMGQSSNLARRIRRILDMGQSRRSLTPTRSLSMVLLLAISLLPLSTMQLSRASAQTATITISVALPQGMKDQVSDQLTQEFESAHPGVTIAFVDAVEVPDPVDGLDNYFSAVQKAANSADVLMTMTMGRDLSVVPHGTRAGYFLDLTPLVNSDSSLNVDDFYPQVWKSFQWDNAIWALPSSADLMVLSYDKAAFDKAGLAYPTGKWTVDDFANAVSKLTTRDADNHVVRAGFANTGRIFRLALWQSLLGNTKLYDETSIPNQPQFAKPEVEKILDTYRQLEQQGAISNGTTEPAMIVDDIVHAQTDLHSAALLPGDKAGLMTAGFAISAGTQHPDLAYALVKFLTTRDEMNFLRIPARKSMAAQMDQDPRLAPIKPYLDQALANGMNYSEMRFTSYLNAAWAGNESSAKDAVQNVEMRAINDLKAADAKKGTLTLAIIEPTAPVLPAGKIALKFDMVSFTGEVNKDLWNKVIQDFTASDPQVGLVKMKMAFETADEAAAKSDCFFLPTNAVPTMTGNTLLNLDPFLNADPSFDKGDLAGSVLASVQRDNKTYALPVAIEPLILRYDSAKFSAANLPEPSNDWTVETFADALKALKPTSEGHGPFVDADSNGTYLLVLIADYGGLPLDFRTNPPTINFTDPAAVTATKQVLDLAKNVYIGYSALGSLNSNFQNFPDNTTAIYPGHLSGISRKIAPGAIPDKPVLFPMGHQYTGLAYTLHTAYISTQSQNPEACYRFISTIAKHPELFSAMPARRSLLNGQELKAATSPEVLALYNQADALLKDSRTIAFPSFDKGTVSVSNFLLEHWLFEAFDGYVLNGADLETALKTADGYAKTYQGCTATLPTETLLAANDHISDATKAYVACAEKADSRLKPILDPLISH